jgi:hypothetical protein
VVKTGGRGSQSSVVKDANIGISRGPSHAWPMVVCMKVLSSRSLAWFAAAVCFGALSVSTALGAQVPILAGPWSLHQRGYGHARPSTIYNGGDPTGLVQHIKWKTWGAAQAVGTGIAEYVGPHQIVPEGSQQAARIVLFRLGSCRGRRAYDAIEWYFPQHDQHFDPHRYIDACTGTYHPTG